MPWIWKGAGLAACLVSLACRQLASTGLTGVVLDKLTGRPAASIQLQMVGYDDPGHVPPDGSHEWIRNTHGGWAETDGQGRFSFTVNSGGRYSLEANPPGRVWSVPNEIQLEIPAPRHPQFIDLVEGQRLDLGTVFARSRADVAKTYGPVCGALTQSKKVTPKLDFDIVVLQQSQYAPSGWFSDWELERGLLQNWRPATPTLICVVRETSHAGVYREHPSPGSDMLAASPMDPYSASALSQQIYVLDRNGMESHSLSSSPPSSTTTPLDTMSGQARELRWSLLLRLRKR